MKWIIMPGDLVLNESRIDHSKPGTRTEAIGMVVTRTDIELPLYAGLAVWVRYLNDPGVSRIALLSDLTMIAPSQGPTPSNTEYSLSSIEPHQYTDRSTAEERVAMSIVAPRTFGQVPFGPPLGGGTGFYGGFLDEMDEVWNTPHASDSAIDVSGDGPTFVCFPQDWPASEHEPWYVRSGRWLARRAHKALAPVVDKMEAWGWN